MSMIDSRHPEASFWALEKKTARKGAWIAAMAFGAILAALVLFDDQNNAASTCGLVKDIQASQHGYNATTAEITDLLAKHYPAGMREETVVASFATCGFKIYSRHEKVTKFSKEEEMVALAHIHATASVFYDEVQIVVKFANDRISGIVGEVVSHRL